MIVRKDRQQYSQHISLEDVVFVPFDKEERKRFVRQTSNCSSSSSSSSNHWHNGNGLKQISMRRFMYALMFLSLLVLANVHRMELMDSDGGKNDDVDAAYGLHVHLDKLVYHSSDNLVVNVTFLGENRFKFLKFDKFNGKTEWFRNGLKVSMLERKSGASLAIVNQVPTILKGEKGRLVAQWKIPLTAVPFNDREQEMQHMKLFVYSDLSHNKMPFMLVQGKNEFTIISSNPHHLNEFVASVNIDKTIYQQGDDVLVRSFFFRKADYMPLVQDELQANSTEVISPIRFCLLSPKGKKTEYVPKIRVIGNVIMLETRISGLENIGAYQIFLTKFPEEVKWQLSSGRARFRVRAPLSAYGGYFNMHFRLERDSYAPGERVVGFLRNVVFRDSGQIAKRASVDVVLTLGPNVLYENEDQPFYVDAKGHCKIDFLIPSNLGENISSSKNVASATLMITVIDDEYQGGSETISVPVPILLNKLEIQVFTEGENLVAGQKNRVYIKAVNPATGEPANVKASIHAISLDGSSKRRKTIGTVVTKFNGRGRSTDFKVNKDKRYVLRIAKPYQQGVALPMALPVENDAAMITLINDQVSFSPVEPIVLGIIAKGMNRVSLYKHDHLLDSMLLPCGNGKQITKASLRAPNNTFGDGILRVVLTPEHDASRVVAMRNVFRQPSQRLQVKIKPLGGLDSSGRAKPDTRLMFEVETILINHVNNSVTPISAVIGVGVTINNVGNTHPQLDHNIYLNHEGSLPRIRDLDNVFGSEKNLELFLSTTPQNFRSEQQLERQSQVENAEIHPPPLGWFRKPIQERFRALSSATAGRRRLGAVKQQSQLTQQGETKTLFWDHVRTLPMTTETGEQRFIHHVYFNVSEGVDSFQLNVDAFSSTQGAFGSSSVTIDCIPTRQ